MYILRLLNLFSLIMMAHLESFCEQYIISEIGNPIILLLSMYCSWINMKLALSSLYVWFKLFVAAFDFPKFSYKNLSLLSIYVFYSSKSDSKPSILLGVMCMSSDASDVERECSTLARSKRMICVYSSILTFPTSSLLRVRDFTFGCGVVFWTYSAESRIIVTFCFSMAILAAFHASGDI